MPHLDNTFLVSQLFWLFITLGSCYLVILYYLIPNIQSSIQKREDIIASDLEEAESLTRQANAIHIATEKTILNAYTETGIVREKAILQAQLMINQKIDEMNHSFFQSVQAEEIRADKIQAELLSQLPIIIEEVKQQVMNVIMTSYTK